LRKCRIERSEEGVVFAERNQRSEKKKGLR
jgi:hypothetical protein